MAYEKESFKIIQIMKIKFENKFLKEIDMIL